MGEITPTSVDRIDTGKPHLARVYDWFLGGRDNYPVDEELGRQIVALEPQSKYAAQHNRWFMQRATRHLAGAAGAREEMGRFFDGLDLLEPGIAWLPDWRAELGVDEVRNGSPVPLYAGVARKP